MINPLVSICIPTYNGEKYIAEAMISAIQQTYRPLEIIVSDDASKDATLDIIKSFQSITDIPIQIYHHQPAGIGANWNHCVEKSKGEYVKFLFQDDVLLPNCIEKMVNTFLNFPEIGLVACKRTFIVEDNMKSQEIEKWIEKFGNLQKEYERINQPYYYLTKEVFKKEIFYFSPLKNKIGEPTCVMFKKNITHKIGFFALDLKQILDYEYWYRILKKQPIIVLNDSLVKFRIHQAQETNVNRNKTIDDYKKYDKILYDNYLELLHPQVKNKLKNTYDKKRIVWHFFRRKFKHLLVKLNLRK